MKKIFPDEVAKEMELLLREAKTASEIKRIQSVMLGARGISSPVIETIVGYEAPHIRRIWRQYRLHGNKCLIGERRGQVRGRARLNLKEENEFLEPFFEKAKKAGILVVPEIQREYEKRYDMKVHHSLVYNLLHRHGWRKIMPRPSHPKSDKEKQKEFLASFPPKGKRSHARSAS